MNFEYKLDNNLLTLEDQKEALKNPYQSYWFAKANIPGSDFKALQTKVCEDPYFAYKFAKNIPGADIKYCQEHACKNSNWAFFFAADIPKSDKEYCFKHSFPEKEYGPNKWKSEYNKFIMQKACE